MSNESPEHRLDYGGAIQRLREERGMTREALADAAGISPSYLYEVERGLKRPSADILAKLASAFGMLPSQVLEYIESRTLPPRLGIAYHASPALRRESARVLEHADLPMMVASPAPVRSTLQMLVSVVQELSEDDLKVLLDLARHLRAKRK